MRSTRRTLSRASSIGFGTLFLTLTYACTERAVAPSATDDANAFAVNGILSSSLWRVNGSQLEYAGTVSAQAHITQDNKGVHQDFGPATTTMTPVAPLATQRFGSSLLSGPSSNKLPVGDGRQLSYRSRLTSPRVNLTARDGKRVSIQSIADPRGGGRPPVATMLYDGDKPVSLIEGLYEKEGKRWKPTRARITVFGKDGKPSVVTENNLTALQTASVAMPGTAASLADGFRRVGGTLSQLIRPDVLYAATAMDEDESRCWAERIALAGAVATQIGTDIALSLAITACGVTGGVACPAVIAASLAVAGAAANYLVRVMAYDECMSRPATPIIAATGNSGGGGESGDGCYDVEWEISYDGGWSAGITTARSVFMNVSTRCEPAAFPYGGIC